MKKTIYLFITVTFITLMLLLPIGKVKAATLDNVEVEVSKTKVEPGQEVTVTTKFGKQLGSYTMDVAYDNKLFDYVSSEGGTENDNGTRVRLSYYDTTGGTSPRTSASITFKAKETLTTSNPTDFAITLEGLANSDASETYDDITTPIKKDVLVEPNYVDYSLALNYTGKIEPKVAKDMTLITSSTMGKNYDHVRLIVEITAEPTQQATTKLLAIKNDGTEVDLIQNGWGEADGYAIGGKNVKQELKLRGEFSEVGNYAVYVKLIDRDDSDKVIVEKTFNLSVEEKKVENTEITTPSDTNKPEELPDTLPKTGGTKYAIILLTIAILTIVYYFIMKKKDTK